MLGFFLILAAFGISLTLSWRKNISAGLVIVVLEGCLRKWFLPGQDLVVYFLKDVFIVTGLVRGYAELGRGALRWTSPVLLGVTGAAAVYIILDAFNPQGSPFVGIFGVKSYLLYALIAPLGPALFPGKQDLCGMFRTTVWLSTPVCLLAVAQFYAPTSSPLNVYAINGTEMLDIATFGSSGNARVTGTFPYLSGMGCFINFGTLCCLCLYMLSVQRKDRTACYIALPLLLTAGYMTGARSVVFFQTFTIIIYLFVSGLRFAERLALILVVGFGAYYSGPGEAARSAFTSRLDDIEIEGAGTTFESLLGPVTAAWQVAFDVGPIGYGTGSAHQARPSIEARMPIIGQAIPVVPEWELPRNMVELGPIGFLLWVAVRLGWTAVPLISAFHVHDATRRRILLLLFCFLSVQYSIPIVYNHVFSLYFWLISGCVLSLGARTPWNQRTERRAHAPRWPKRAESIPS